jgi:hypothetical protein
MEEMPSLNMSVYRLKVAILPLDLPCSGPVTISPGMEEMPSLNKPVQKPKVAILPLDLPCCGPVTHSGETLTTGKFHGKKPDGYL